MTGYLRNMQLIYYCLSVEETTDRLPGQLCGLGLLGRYCGSEYKLLLVVRKVGNFHRHQKGQGRIYVSES